MARTVNEQEYATKRAEILDAAQALMYRKGFDQVTIKDILDAAAISKGAFYHYFDSKPALLEALIARMQDEGERMFIMLMHDRELPTVPKLQRIFDTLGRWKTDRKEYLLSLMRVWYADENAVVRLRVQSSMVEHVTPLLGALIAEGVAEGAFSTPYPLEAGRMLLTMLIGIGDIIIDLLTSSGPLEERMARADRLYDAYNDAVLRILGAPGAPLHLIDVETMREWFVSASDGGAGAPAAAGGAQ